MKQVLSQSKVLKTVGKKILSQRTIRQASALLAVVLGSFALAMSNGDVDSWSGTSELMAFAYDNSVSSDFIDGFCESTALFIMLSMLLGDDTADMPYIEVIASGDRTLTQNSFVRGLYRAVSNYGFDQMGSISSDVGDNLVAFYSDSSNVGFLLYYPNMLITRAGFCLAKLEF